MAGAGPSVNERSNVEDADDIIIFSTSGGEIIFMIEVPAQKLPHMNGRKTKKNCRTRCFLACGKHFFKQALRRGNQRVEHGASSRGGARNIHAALAS